MLDKFEVYIQRASRAILWLMYVSIVFVILMIVVDVAGRYLFNRPLPATVEISMIIMPIIVYPAFAYALAAGQHVRVSLITDRIPLRARLACEIIASMLGLLFGVLTTYWGWLFFWESFVIREILPAAIPVPLWLGKFFVPFGGFFFALCFLLLLLRNLNHLSIRRKE